VVYYEEEKEEEEERHRSFMAGVICQQQLPAHHL
jgi:hypothetical protein